MLGRVQCKASGCHCWTKCKGQGGPDWHLSIACQATNTSFQYLLVGLQLILHDCLQVLRQLVLLCLQHCLLLLDLDIVALKVRIGPREVLILPAAHTAGSLQAAISTQSALATAGDVQSR